MFRLLSRRFSAPYGPRCMPSERSGNLPSVQATSWQAKQDRHHLPIAIGQMPAATMAALPLLLAPVWCAVLWGLRGVPCTVLRPVVPSPKRGRASW